VKVIVQDQALKLASQITHPVTVAVFAAVLAASAFIFALRSKKPRVAWVLAVGIIVLGLAPLMAQAISQWRGIYHVRVFIFGPDHSLVDEVRIVSSAGGESKRVEGGWEIDIPAQTRPEDGRLTLFASVDDAFLSGSSTLQLAADYYPSTTIQLSADISAIIRGTVIDEGNRLVAGATVSVEGYSDEVATDRMGNFSLPAHAAQGQIVQLRVQKGNLLDREAVPAGRGPLTVVLRRR
jgi:hypothetical protein